MSSPIKGLEDLEPSQNQSTSNPPPVHKPFKSNDLSDLFAAALSRERSTRHGGRPVASISGNRPTKRLGHISGTCTQCKKPAVRRFEKVQYCNRHYRLNLLERKDAIYYQQHCNDPGFKEFWEKHLKEREEHLKYLSELDKSSEKE